LWQYVRTVYRLREKVLISHGIADNVLAEFDDVFLESCTQPSSIYIPGIVNEGLSDKVFFRLWKD
jgi:hypothetical protein